MWAAAYNRLENVRVLLAAGADPNGCDNSGGTALMSASARGHTEILQVLLHAGADPLQEDREGKTALSLAEEHHPEIARLLRQPEKQG